MGTHGCGDSNTPWTLPQGGCLPKYRLHMLCMGTPVPVECPQVPLGHARVPTVPMAYSQSAHSAHRSPDFFILSFLLSHLFLCYWVWVTVSPSGTFSPEGLMACQLLQALAGLGVQTSREPPAPTLWESGWVLLLFILCTFWSSDRTEAPPAGLTAS